MGTPTLGAQGGYVNVAVVVSAAAQTAILAEIDKLTALFNVADGAIAASPDFDMMPPHMADKLVVEITALKAAIDAAPEA